MTDHDTIRAELRSAELELMLAREREGRLRSRAEGPGDGPQCQALNDIEHQRIQAEHGHHGYPDLANIADEKFDQRYYWSLLPMAGKGKLLARK